MDRKLILLKGPNKIPSGELSISNSKELRFRVGGGSQEAYEELEAMFDVLKRYVEDLGFNLRETDRKINRV